MAPFRPTWVEVSVEAFTSNLSAIKNWIGSSVELLAVLKADGYGHGAAALAPFALKNGASSLGVSSLEEGIHLRESGIQAPILILGSLYPLENFAVAVRHHLTPTVSSLEAAHALQKSAIALSKPVSFHLKIDTGMGRLGVSVSGAKALLEWLAAQKEITLAGVYSHLACADSDAEFTHEQARRFEEVRALIKKMNFQKVSFHLANSAAMWADKNLHYQMVRPGISLYGVSLTTLPNDVSLKPALEWKSKIVFLKKVAVGTSISYGRSFVASSETEVATVPVGYADGLPRRASNKGFVLIKGRRCPILGRVTMDHIMVNVTGLGINVGEPVVIIGRQGEAILTVFDWAEWADSIPYEIFCGISKRVPRMVIG